MARHWTSDLHFAHKNITEFTQRHLATTKEDHDQWLHKLWNSTVNPKDTVIHCGDFCFSWKMLPDLIASLNGRKVFIVGNHDDEEKLRAACSPHDRVYNMWRTTLNSQKIEVCHFPWESWRSQANGSWHIHGHCHGNLKRDGGRRLDVGLDNAFNLFNIHRFFSDDDLIEILGRKPIYSSDSHRKVQDDSPFAPHTRPDADPSQPPETA